MKKSILIFIFILFESFFYLGCNSENKQINNYIKSELLLLDTNKNYIELLNCSTTTYNDLNIIIISKDGKTISGSIDDLYIGMENIYIEYNEKYIETILIDQNPLFPNIRVAIRSDLQNISNEEGLYHEELKLRINGEGIIKTFDCVDSFKIKDKNLEIKAADNELIIGDYIINKRILIESNNEIAITSIERALGIPSYSGRIELTAENGKILVVNKVNMEDYLQKVVPSEMPASWNIEALKAQAVAARTYAYNEIYNKSFLNKGYIVDDSEISQVYNNHSKNDKVSQAVRDTKGITMFHGYGDSKLPIKAYYYSSSSGLTASGNEVWFENKKEDEITYVIGKNITDEKVNVNDEKSMLSFFKKININSISGNSINHRWHIKFSKEDLQNILNKNLKSMAKKYPNSFFTYKNKKWIKSEIPNNIGKVTNVYVGERGKSGIVMSIIIDTTSGSYKICNQYNIRFTLKPSDSKNDIFIEKANYKNSNYTMKVKNPTILPSAFFAIEWVNNNMHIYGGGLGHGVGMCQYGANKLANDGYSYKKILDTFYSDIEFIDTSKDYKPLEDFEKYFK